MSVDGERLIKSTAIYPASAQNCSLSLACCTMAITLSRVVCSSFQLHRSALGCRERFVDRGSLCRKSTWRRLYRCILGRWLTGNFSPCGWIGVWLRVSTEWTSEVFHPWTLANNPKPCVWSHLQTWWSTAHILQILRVLAHIYYFEWAPRVVVSSRSVLSEDFGSGSHIGKAHRNRTQHD